MTGNAHLVGSMCFRSAEEGMRAIGAEAGAAVDWIPDGEPGSRSMWVANPTFRDVLGRTRGLTPARASDVLADDLIAFGLEPGASVEEVATPRFGYADAATASYKAFRRLRDAGTLAPDTRFLVALPTPVALLVNYIIADDRQTLEPILERSLLDDLFAILGAIPHEDLAIQWDVAVEFNVLEGRIKTGFMDESEPLGERLARLGDAVPVEVPLSYHFCYGSPFDMHVNEPADTGKMVDLARALFAHIARPVQRLHLPVPIERVDATFYAPLADLAVPEDTRLYLGLLHYEDGLDGATRRIAAARTAVEDFGVAAECGFARTPTDQRAFLRLHQEAAAVAEQRTLPEVDVPERPLPQSAVDQAAINARLREFAAKVSCSTCEAAATESCRDPRGNEAERPHFTRYQEAVYATVADGPAMRA